MKKKFSATKMVKEISRERIGPVPPTKLLPHKNKRAPKHPKKDMEQEGI